MGYSFISWKNSHHFLSYCKSWFFSIRKSQHSNIQGAVWESILTIDKYHHKKRRSNWENADVSLHNYCKSVLSLRVWRQQTYQLYSPVSLPIFHHIHSQHSCQRLVKKAITDKMARFIGSDIRLVGYARGEGFRVMTELEQHYKSGTTVGSAAYWQHTENTL